MWKNLHDAFTSAFRKRGVQNQYYLKWHLTYYELELLRRLHEDAANRQNNQIQQNN